MDERGDFGEDVTRSSLYEPNSWPVRNTLRLTSHFLQLCSFSEASSRSTAVQGCPVGQSIGYPGQRIVFRLWLEASLDVAPQFARWEGTMR